MKLKISLQWHFKKTARVFYLATHCIIKMDAATLKCVNDGFQPWLGHTSYHNTCVAIVKQLLVQRDMVELHKVTMYKPGKKTDMENMKESCVGS